MVFKPNYIKLLKDGTLRKKVEETKKHLTDCYLCPHECGVDRTKKVGFCGATDKAIVSSYGPHFGEEDMLVGTRGSGTIFFGYCNMRCVFCQNYELSFEGEGNIVSNGELADIMLLLQNHYRCHNINFVTPTHFIPNIIEALYIAVRKGFHLPLVYNCGGYERIEILRILDGLVDIYMPDFKYSISERGKKYSKVADYSDKIKLALKEMDRQVEGLKVDKRGIAYRGLLIRHLMLPGGLEDTKKVLEFIKKELSHDCLVNLMSQYYPTHKAFEYDEINRRLGFKEYQQAYAFAQKLGLRLD
ncbi:Radical SAM domain protein [[Clostridium] ultunense Esp]|uniref:Radical SAM domain protein n=1 Tax=[Clostridium] ultunense Esp TaxID=1288971 RepID=M1ZKR0_9FIRM|nr:radical SAM protein [Schnuerera ultunensis]CCQ95887.1 Radical SAM domain protein [[Clostridium] ultunense Esp]SHD78004.1 Radical SAM domain protein [[Clostridium] ultunense Esp]